MTPTQLFMAVFPAVMAGGLGVVGVVWGFAKYSRLEEAGTEKGSDGTAALIAIIVPMLLMLAMMYVTLR